MRIAIAVLVVLLSTASAQAGKEPKWQSFQQTYSSVTDRIKGDTGKMAKARAIRASVKGALDTMDRSSFYSHVAKKEAELLGLVK
jgi:hypothetical protein